MLLFLLLLENDIKRINYLLDYLCFGGGYYFPYLIKHLIANYQDDGKAKKYLKYIPCDNLKP